MIGSLLLAPEAQLPCHAILDGTEELTRKSLDQIAVDMTAQAPPPRPGAETVTSMLTRDRAELIVAEHAAGRSHSARFPRPTATAPPRSAITSAGCGPRASPRPGTTNSCPISPTAGRGSPTTRTCGPLPCSPSSPSPGLQRSQGDVLPGTGTSRHPDAPLPGLPSREHERVLAAVSPAGARSHSRCPKPAAPVAGETLASFLGRLAAVNRTSPDALLDILPHWFRVKARWHNNRWQPARLIFRWRTTPPRRSPRSAARPRQPSRPRFPPSAGSAAGPSGMLSHAGSAPQRAASSIRSRSIFPLTSISAASTGCGFRAGNTAVQCQGLSRHPGRRTPGTPASPSLQHRRTRLYRSPGTPRGSRETVETPGGGAYRDEPSVRSRIQLA